MLHTTPKGRVERAAETFASRVVEANREASAKTQAGLLAAAQGKNVAYTKEVAEMDEKVSLKGKELGRQSSHAEAKHTVAEVLMQVYLGGVSRDR